MTNKVVLVTPPDDVISDGFRILLVNLNRDQTDIVSKCLTQSELLITTVAYIWNSGDPVSWLIEKKHKSDIIIFNAEAPNENITGYLAAQPNSYYFGNLQDLFLANNNVIYTLSECSEIFNLHIGNYERRSK